MVDTVLSVVETLGETVDDKLGDTAVDMLVGVSVEEIGVDM